MCVSLNLFIFVTDFIINTNQIFKNYEIYKIVCSFFFMLGILNSCTSSLDETSTIVGAENTNNTEVRTSFSQDEFASVLTTISNGMEKKQTRSSLQLTENDAELLIAPLTEDGEKLRDLILADESISAVEKDSLLNMTPSELALASLTINLLLSNSNETRVSASRSETCLFNAIAGVSTGGGFMKWGAKTISKAVCKRVLLAGIGGFVGGALFVAWAVWEYQKCMEG